MWGNFEAVLFDNDGTLIDSTPAILRCWNQWAAEHPRASLDRSRIFGRTAEAIVADCLPPHEVSAAVARYEELETADPLCTLLPGARTLTDALPAGRWAVVTSATRQVAEARLRHAGIDPPLMITADDTSRGKPDPEPFLTAAARLGVAPASCLVVEDAPAGLAAARAAGMRSLAVATTHSAHQLDADVVVAALHDVRLSLSSDGSSLSLHHAPEIRASHAF